jgi:hypothetical protein
VVPSPGAANTLQNAQDYKGKHQKSHTRTERHDVCAVSPAADLFRQSVYSRVAGYEDVNDAERLAQDPAFRLIGWCGVDFLLAELRDRDTGRGGELRWPGARQLRTDR